MLNELKWWTALSIGDVTSLEELYNENPLYLNILNKRGENGLHEACRHGHLDVVYLFLSYEMDLNVQDIGSKWTALILACVYQNKEIVKVLLQSGADTEIYCKHRCTPLYFACLSGNIDIVQLLLQYNADPHHLNDIGLSAIIAALSNHHYECVMMLLRAGVKIDELFKVPGKYNNVTGDPSLMAWINDHLYELSPDNLPIWKKYRLKRVFTCQLKGELQI